MAKNIVRNINNIKRFPRSLWTPADIDTALWLDAADTSTITTATGNDVSNWADKSGNGRDMAQGTALSQPQTGSTIINGLNAIYFDGINDGMHTVAGATWLNNTEFTIFAVALEHTWNSQNSMINCTGNVDSNSNFDIGRGSDFDYWDFRTPTGSSIWQSTPAAFDPLLSVTQFQNTGSQHWMFGTDYGTATNPSSAITGITEPFNIGLPDLSAYNYSGSVAELVIITGSVSTETREEMENYLALKWGLELVVPE
jgi:hypothetical protein